MFEGVHVAVATPFRKDGSVDYAAYEGHLQFLIKQGVHGFVPCGTTGEGPTINQEEYQRLIRLCLKLAAPKKMSVIAGCGGNSTAAVIELCKEAKELECDAALVVTPYYNKPTPEGVIAHYTTIAEKTNFPIVLYNVPPRTNVKMSAEVMLKLLEHPLIVGVKEASGDYSLWTELASSMDLKKSLLWLVMMILWPLFYP